jgi:hypothetical protein
MQVRRYPSLAQLAIFTIVGPPVGALAILLWGTLFGQPPLRLGLWEWLVVTFPIAYVYAGVPALVTGCVAALARSVAGDQDHGSRLYRFAVPVVAGAVTSVLFSLVTLASEPDVVVGVIGAFAAFVCTSFAERLLRLRPN